MSQFKGMPAVIALSVLTLGASPTWAQPPMTREHHPIHRMHGRERHPAMRHALKALLNAKRALKHAEHDFQGHRAKALDLVDQAISEVRAGLASDRH